MFPKAEKIACVLQYQETKSGEEIWIVCSKKKKKKKKEKWAKWDSFFIQRRFSNGT